jgi:hypothetical protein
MKIIITEEQFKRFNRSSPALENGIYKFLNQYISSGTRKIGTKSRNYGSFREDWCIDGKKTIMVSYDFDDNDKFERGRLFVSKKLVDTICEYFVIKLSYAIHVIEDWYDNTMVPKFQEIVGEKELFINNIHLMDNENNCVPEPVKPEGITDEEMIDFIVKNTLYTKEEVLDKINSGERELEDFYLEIVDIVNRKIIQGF